LTPREGRKFAFTLAPAFLALAGLLFWRAHVLPAMGVAVAGVALTLAGALVPDRLGPVWRLWMGMAHAISRVTTPVVLTILYFLLILPVGVLRRSLGGNPLVRPAGASFWVRRAPGSRRSDLGRQF
jgi:hypothetical protein